MSDVKNSYETVFILSTKLGEEGIASAVQKFKDLIAANGSIDNVDEWGKRRLAYPINKEEEGHYTLIAFTSSPEFTAELDRIYNITDGVLRSLIVKKEAPENAKPDNAKPDSAKPDNAKPDSAKPDNAKLESAKPEKEKTEEKKEA